MRKMGLTGGIASGKSTVAGMLRELGFPVLEADLLSHQLMQPGQAAHDARGRIDRAKLAAIVFVDAARLAKLNQILHPRVEEATLRQFLEWERDGVRDAAFVEAALLVEAGYVKNLDGLVVAFCRPEQQLERLRARGMSETEARQRMAAQMPVEEKLEYATDRIDCSGTIEETQGQVRALAEKLRAVKS